MILFVPVSSSGKPEQDYVDCTSFFSIPWFSNSLLLPLPMSFFFLFPKEGKRDLHRTFSMK